MTNEAEVDRAFAYARAGGMGVIVGVPEHGLLGRAETKRPRDGHPAGHPQPRTGRPPLPDAAIGPRPHRIARSPDRRLPRRRALPALRHRPFGGGRGLRPAPARRPSEGRHRRDRSRRRRRGRPGGRRPPPFPADARGDGLPGDGRLRVREGRPGPPAGTGRIRRLRPGSPRGFGPGPEDLSERRSAHVDPGTAREPRRLPRLRHPGHGLRQLHRRDEGHPLLPQARRRRPGRLHPDRRRLPRIPVHHGRVHPPGPGQKAERGRTAPRPRRPRPRPHPGPPLPRRPARQRGPLLGGGAGIGKDLWYFLATLAVFALWAAVPKEATARKKALSPGPEDRRRGPPPRPPRRVPRPGRRTAGRPGCRRPGGASWG